MRDQYEEAAINSANQKSRNAKTVKIVQIANGFLVNLGLTGAPVYCEHIKHGNSNSPTILELLEEFYEENVSSS